MNDRPQRTVKERAVLAAESALAEQQHVSAIDVLVGMGFLAPSHVEAWRRGRLACLEEVLQVGQEKLDGTLSAFLEWARERGLKATEVAYSAPPRHPRPELQFSRSGDPEVEKFFRTHFASPHLSEKRTEKIRERLGQPAELVVFSILRDSKCSECKTELEQGSFLFMEAGQPLCLACADLDHLVYLPSGDAALTRRSKKYSTLSAVVVRFSRSSKRYERQGLLVEEAALERAEQECLSDAEMRAARCEREALRRTEEDQELVKQMAASIRNLFPGCPPAEAQKIGAHTAVRGSGRVGRSAAGRTLEPGALTAAVVAYVRHNHTNYDELLMQGNDRAFARQQVGEQIDDILDRWRAGRPAIAS